MRRLDALTGLLPVYHGDAPLQLSVALESVCNQTVSLREIVLVVDGPISDELDNVIRDFSDKLPLNVVRLPVNSGLAAALNFGLSKIKSEWVVRFDADDVCDSRRVEKQLALISADAYDVIGSWVNEFYSQPNCVVGVRRVPLLHEEIIEFLRFRNPMNHMSVCFRASVVRAVGGYPTDIPFMEDYALWAKCAAAGAGFANLPESLVSARVGAGMYARRGGWLYVKSEMSLQALLVKLGLKPRWQGVSTLIVRGFVFCLPTYLRRVIYQRLLRD